MNSQLPQTLAPTLARTLAATLLAFILTGCVAPRPRDDAPRREPSQAPIGALFAPPGAQAPASGLSGRLEDPFHRSGARTVHLLQYSEENSALVADLARDGLLAADRVHGPLRSAPVDAEGTFALGEVPPGIWGLAWPCSDAAPADGPRAHWIFTRFEAEGGAERIVLKCLQPQ